MGITTSMERRERLVFPYRLVLRHDDGTTETLDDEHLPIGVPDSRAEIHLADHRPRRWEVERVEHERDFVPTESELAADPSIRLGTIYLRPARRRRPTWLVRLLQKS